MGFTSKGSGKYHTGQRIRNTSHLQSMPVRHKDIVPPKKIVPRLTSLDEAFLQSQDLFKYQGNEMPFDNSIARNIGQVNLDIIGRSKVVVFGGGAVGGPISIMLAKAGAARLGGQLVIIDHDTLSVENLSRHPLGSRWLGENKAFGLASQIREQMPGIKATAIASDILKLTRQQMVDILSGASIAVVAMDNQEAQLVAGEAIHKLGIPAIFPGVWADDNFRDASVFEIIWVDRKRQTPCYFCLAGWRPRAISRRTGGRPGLEAEWMTLPVFAMAVILEFLDPSSRGLTFTSNPLRNIVLIHGAQSVDPELQNVFSGPLSWVQLNTTKRRDCPWCSS